MRTSESGRLLARAQAVIPGGVNSPVRAFRAVGGVPRFITRGQGAHVVDADGNEYLDYVTSWGALILGHADAEVLRAIQEAAARGTSFGAPTELEVELAEAVREAMPAVEMLRMVNSGTEATMSALRLARAITSRERVLKFEGCYHGHVDGLLLGAGSGVATLGIPGSPGVPRAYVELTVQVPYNDLAAARTAFARYGAELACVIVEPVAGNMGCILPEPGFLEGLRAMCDEFSALLIFDEVITGFRIARGGAQARYGVTPDLTCLGKILGGGLPAAAYGGRRALMEQVAPSGPVYQAGTLAGNPLAMAAGLATLRHLARPGVYVELEQRTQELAAGFLAAALEAKVELSATSAGAIFGFFFRSEPVRNLKEAQASDLKRFAAFHRAMLERGVYLAPSAFEAGFVSTAHAPADIAATVAAAREAFRVVSKLN